MLGGIVTELGGLMSHGAVVAREYGLPCVVGALNATKIFKTGEKVILDARNGTVTKVKNK
jgi:pyruvate,water dikinase